MCVWLAAQHMAELLQADAVTRDAIHVLVVQVPVEVPAAYERTGEVKSTVDCNENS